MAQVNWHQEIECPTASEIPEGVTLVSESPDVIFSGRMSEVLAFTRDYLMLENIDAARDYLVK